MKSCFLIGHREAASEVLAALAVAIEQHIAEYGVTEFIVGNYGGFDHMAAKAVAAAKKRHPASNARDLVEYAKKREQRSLISVTVLPRSEIA